MSEQNTGNEPIVNPNPAPQLTPTAPTVNYEDLIAKARTDEKNKLYPEIEKLKTEVAKNVERINALLISVAEKDELLKQKDKELAEKDAKYTALEKEGANGMDKELKALQEQLAQLQADLAKKDEEIVQVKAKAEVDNYKATKLKDLDEDFHDLVIGNSKEEIDASFAKAKEKFEKIATKYGVQANPQVGLPKPNPSVVNNTYKGVKPEDIAKMSPAEYAEYRKNLGFKTRRV